MPRSSSVSGAAGSRPCKADHCSASSRELAGSTTPIRLAVPDGEPGPRPRIAARRGTADLLRPVSGGSGGSRLGHAPQGLGGAARGTDRQAGDHSASREHVRVCRQQGRGHGAAGGQSGDKDAARVRGEALHRRGDHLPDRQRFTMPAARVLGRNQLKQRP